MTNNQATQFCFLENGTVQVKGCDGSQITGWMSVPAVLFGIFAELRALRENKCADLLRNARLVALKECATICAESGIDNSPAPNKIAELVERTEKQIL